MLRGFFTTREEGEAAEKGNQSGGGGGHGGHGGSFRPGGDEMRWDPTLQKPQPVCELTNPLAVQCQDPDSSALVFSCQIHFYNIPLVNSKR